MMKLFYWTERECEICNHHAVFAEDADEARALVVADIQSSWEYNEPGTGEPDEWCREQGKKVIDDFLTNPKWRLTVCAVKPGIVSLGW